MKKTSRFNEAKIGMVMKLRRISREEAIAEINHSAEGRQTGETAPEGEPVSSRRCWRPRCEDPEMMSAEEFFMGV